jgi:iron complex transport system ATP-binding protein
VTDPRSEPEDVEPTGERHTLGAEHLRLAYEKLEVVRDLSLSLPQGKISVIVGANACGKSTLLRALARLLKPKGGVVLLDGESIQSQPTKVVARKLGILPQSPVAPEGISVADLVSRGRYAHQKWFRQWSKGDEDVITSAMLATETLDLASRPVDELSGGQRQRVWIAMALAQGTDILLLDEPTTYLDLNHQIEVMDLLTDLNQRDGRTIVLVLHELSQACRYAHHLIAMKAGDIVAEGPPAEIVTPELVHHVFDVRCRVEPNPVSGTPMVVPIGRHDEDAVRTTEPADDAQAVHANGQVTDVGISAERPETQISGSA